MIGFLAWESTSVKTWENSLAAGISTGSVTGNYLERPQQHSELRSNDVVLIQEHEQNVSRVQLEYNQRLFYKTRLFKSKVQF